MFADGSIKDPRTIVDANLEPMYQDEYIIGYQTAVGKNWSVGVRGIYRDLISTIEDVAIDAALNEYAVAKGYGPGTALDFEAGGFDYYVLTNPGKPMTVYVDFGTGTPEKVDLTAQALRYPESTRKYYAVELFAERLWDGKWYANFNYTWSQSYGNNEGYVRSDNGQDDAGLTTLFDQPGLLDGGYGFLPNDKRHRIKAFGAYKLNSEWQAGANFLAESGKPRSAFGYHPTDLFAQAYGAESFYLNGQLVPRGSLGRTPWTTKLDLSLKYRPKFAKDRLTLGVDVFNVYNSIRPIKYDEVGEVNAAPRAQYGAVTNFQTPRYVRFSAEYKY